MDIIKQAANAEGFVVFPSDNKLSLSETNSEHNWGSWVKIIDFNQVNNDHFNVDVRCESLVNLSSVSLLANGSVEAKCEPFSHWDNAAFKRLPEEIGDHCIKLQHTLRAIFHSHRLLCSFYPIPVFESPIWVCQRWLEILPLQQEHRNMFVKQDSLQDAMSFIADIVLSNDIKESSPA
jgi:Lon protease-like protein